MTAAGLNSGDVVEGRYKILDVLGMGGFATVYRARHLRLHSDVALKVLTREANKENSQEYHERFIREAQSAASVKHPNIVGMLDFGIIEERDLPYMVMELLEGRDLKDELRHNGPMDPSRAVKLLMGVLDALGDAHKMGIVHKDLKPSNLFLCDPGTFRERLVVTDFGIARVLNTEQNTSSGQFVGTPQYFAPEYLKSQIALPPLDVYQMGLILVEMMTGRMVVEHSDPMVCFFKHVSGELDIPQFIMDGPLNGVIQGALEFDYHDRFQDGHAFKDALLQVDAGQLAGLEFSAMTVARPPVDIEQSSGVLSAPHSGSFDSGVEREPVPVRASSGVVSQSGVVESGAEGAASVVSALSGSVSSRDVELKESGAVEVAVASGASGSPSSFIGVPSRFAFPLLAVLGLSLAAVMIGKAIVGEDKPATQSFRPPPVVKKSPKAVPVKADAVKADAAKADLPKADLAKAAVAAVPVEASPDSAVANGEGEPEAPGAEAPGVEAQGVGPCEFAEELDESAESVVVDLISEPPNAAIKHDGKALGATPCRWRVERSDEPLTVTMVAPGRKRGKKVSVAVSQDGEVKVKLRASRVRGKGRKKTKTKPDAPADGQNAGSRVGTMR